MLNRLISIKPTSIKYSNKKSQHLIYPSTHINSLIQKRWVPKGSVKWFNVEKGFGFIIRDDGEPDIFFHIKDVNQKEGEFKTLLEGDRVEFEVKQGGRGKYAVSINTIQESN